MRSFLCILLCAILTAPSLPASGATSPYFTAVMASSPVLYYRLGDLDTAYVDSSGSGGDATPGSGAGFGSIGPMIYDSTPNAAAGFNGNGRATINATGTAILQYTYNSTYSVEFCLVPNFNRASAVEYRLTGNRVATGNTEGWGISFESPDSGVNYYLRILMVSTGGLGNYVWANFTGLNWANAVPHCGMVTYNGNHDYTGFVMYVDGQTYASSNIHNTLGTNAVTGTTASIGGWGTGGGNEFKGVIDELAFYNTTLTLSDHLKHLGASSFTRGYNRFPPCNGTPQRVIYDYDPGTDIDDSQDQYIMQKLERMGCVTVAGHVIANRPPSGTNYFPSTSKAFQIYAGMLAPTSVYKGTAYSQADNYATNTVTGFNYLVASTAYEDAITGTVAGLRQLLHDGGANNTILIFTGGCTDAANLLASADTDGYGTGLALVTAKVQAMYWVAGSNFPTGNVSESNLVLDLTATAYLYTNWPTTIPLVMYGVDLGNQIGNIGSNIANSLSPTQNILAYAQSNPNTYAVTGRTSWSAIALLSAAYGYSTVMSGGTQNGFITFVNGADYHWSASPNSNHNYATFRWLSATYNTIFDSWVRFEHHLPWIMPQ